MAWTSPAKKLKSGLEFGPILSWQRQIRLSARVDRESSRGCSQFENNYFTEMCSGSEAGLVFKAHRLCVSLNFRLESNKEEKKDLRYLRGLEGAPRM